MQTEFEAFVDIPVLAYGELFGGKICAALDRQHPRDLFDVRPLLDAEGLTDEVKVGLIAGLLGHNRPIAELLAEQMQDRETAFNAEFAGMTLKAFDYSAHRETFTRLHRAIRSTLSHDDRAFLMSFEQGDPDWSLFPAPDAEHLSGVQLKLRNIRKLKNANPAKHAAGIEALKQVLDEHG